MLGIDAFLPSAEACLGAPRFQLVEHRTHQPPPVLLIIRFVVPLIAGRSGPKRLKMCACAVYKIAK
jgi:hypothetical protein